MNYLRKMPLPEEIKKEYPLSAKSVELKKERDKKIAAVFKGESDKFLLIIGPCSADREDAVLEYIHKLADVQEKVKDKIIIIPRIYTNKPRTTGEGYKGMVHQPDPEKKEDMLKGLLSIRDLHTKAIEQTGLCCADEMLYPENYRYLSDLLSYVAIGARSVENQQHRLTASGLEIPVGMKNPTGGDLSVMINSIIAAQAKQTFLYSDWEVSTNGNPLTHAILRGYVNKHGQSHPNYHYEDIMQLIDMYQKKNLQNMACIIDANHSNSGKKYLEQIRICKEVLHSCKLSDEIRKFVKGFMIESYLVDGNQKIGDGVYGKSITDPCLGWEKSEKLIYDIADLL
ncbi:MAG: 3-deoxy-7-phosphoheptulonate synthase [Oscillospiraceae bacterium]|nr:3-deoxy-7-phosphoheptulonate synthase [Oscillospiraceae bacterium]MDD6084992.1 3-deoxy-7-phosphoheptulonate synthase [Oscillospiraceae bacterium]MDY3256952.1 3-deoxy-7-phosphoheptulonate synthase [Ruminococcus callidus]